MDYGMNEYNQLWNSLELKQKYQFLLISMAFKDAIKLIPKGNAGKFVEIPKIKCSYNSNIYTYISPWCDNKLVFEFMSCYNKKENRINMIFSSNNGTLDKYGKMVESWVKFFNTYNIMEKMI